MSLVQLLFIDLLGLLYRFLIQKGLPCILHPLDLGWNANATHYFNVTCVVTVSTRVLTEVVSQVGTDRACESLGTSRELAYLLVLEVSQLLEVVVLQQLRGRPSLILVVYQHLFDEFDSLS